MADNLDELLDEVEAKFCRNTQLSQPPVHYSVDQNSVREKINHSVSQLEAGGDKDLETVLQEILDDAGDAGGDEDPAVSSEKAAAVKNCAKDSCPQTALKKCCPVFLGGSSITSGIGTSVSQRVCDQLRCTSCDFRVAMFDDYVWDSSCDYLFFRNNMPDCNKLKAKLKRRQGARAYACQCSWHSSISLCELRLISQLKWVCGQHTA